MAERNSGEDQDRRPGDDQEEGPGEHQEQDNADDEPAQASSSWERPSSSWERPGARPGNTPAKQPLTEYKKWYNRNRPGKKERQEEPKPGAFHCPQVSGQALMPRARAAKAKTKAKEKEKKKESRTKESRAKEKVSQARWAVARHPHPHRAKDLQQPWWNQGTASALRKSRTTRTTVRRKKVPRPRPG